ncbi:MAG: preprotein translocase subunit YajC [Candidatus Dasytiphilus stammeri]
MNILIMPAIAADNTVYGNPYSLIIMLLTLGLIFYLIIWRPQKQRVIEHKKMMASLAKGDEILTTGGLIGIVTKITAIGYIVIALNDNTQIIIKRDFIVALLPKGTMKSLDLN